MEHQFTAIEELRSTNHGVQKSNHHDFIQGNDEQQFHKLLITPENGNSFTALLELPPNQAMELLTDNNHNTYNSSSSTNINGDNNNDDGVKRHRISAFNHTLSTLPSFPSNRALIERAAKYSVFAIEDSLDVKVKSEPLDCNGTTAGSESDKEKPFKRKEREKKGKGSSKKNKTTSLDCDDNGEKLPYVHVRARRGQATDSHSLAERARREKINARMKLLQELVPGCNKISGTALVLDEIINHVQYLQRQVEYLSMRLAAVNPRIDFNLDSLISGNEPIMDCNFQSTPTPLMWPEVNLNGDRQQLQPQWNAESLTQPIWVKGDNHRNLVPSDNSLMTYDSPSNSASLHSSQLKMEL